MSRYGYLEVFKRVPCAEITRVDSIVVYLIQLLHHSTHFILSLYRFLVCHCFPFFVLFVFVPTLQPDLMDNNAIMEHHSCLPSNAYYPRTPDYTLCSGVHVCWSEHSDSSFVYGFMILDYGFGTMTATTYECCRLESKQKMTHTSLIILVAYCQIL